MDQNVKNKQTKNMVITPTFKSGEKDKDIAISIDVTIQH
jgi:predicted SnoaL-like aldol condensation-catalyzing enzyme